MGFGAANISLCCFYAYLLFGMNWVDLAAQASRDEAIQIAVIYEEVQDDEDGGIVKMVQK